MANLRRPTREFSFSNHQRLQPNAPPPGNELDGMLHDLREAILSTQEALAELRRDDGQLKNNLVGPDQLRSDLRGTLIGDIAKVTETLTNQVRDAIASQTITIHDVNLLAKDAEAAANAARQWLAQVKQIEGRLLEASTQTEVTSQAITTTVTDTENWATYAQAQADNAAQSEDNALAWAEYLGGPVVSGPDAPLYISQSAWPHGLFYQPIQGFGGLGGLWSAKWWAVAAQQLVGWISTFYLGAWDHHPMPGETNPNTGQMVPNPIPPGSMYFNTTNNKLYVWTGEIWVTPFSLTGGVTSRFAYKATAGQTVFSGPDWFGNEPETEDDTEHDVHVNGVKLSRDYGTGQGDYTVNNTTATLTLLFPVTADSIVQWDILVSADDLRPGAAIIFKIDPIPVDGITVTFTLTYMSGTLSPYITKPVELLVSVDGVIQEAYVDYTAVDNTITFFVPPPATSRVWMIYFRSGNLVALEVAPPPAPVIVLSDNRVAEDAAVNTTVGTLSLINPRTGTPVYHLDDDAGGKFKLVGNAIQVNGPLDFETAISHNITISVSGITPAAAPRTFSIVVQDVPEATIGDIVLTGSTVAEDAIIGMTIGSLSVLNVTGTPLFTLPNNAGGKFFVSGNSLRVAAPLTIGTFLITVAVTGVTPETAQEAFLITVTPAVGVGTINLTGSTIPESATPGTTVGTLSVSGTSGTPIYTLVGNPGAKFAINSGNLLQVAGTLDFETQPSITITVAVGGISPPAPSREFTITVTYVDTVAPTITSASSVSNAENTVLAHALTANEAVTWAIVGGLDVTRFEISGSTLRWLSNGVKDFELPNDSDANNQYVVQVRATDLGGNPSSPQTITVTVTDVFEVSWADFAGGVNTNMTISDANLGMRPATAVNAIAIASAHWKRTGKFYFEVLHTDAGVNGECVGIALENAVVGYIVDVQRPSNAITVAATGNMYAEGYVPYPGTALGVWAEGTKVCFAVDLTNGLFWARKVGGNWNNNAAADPALGWSGAGINIQYISQTRVAPFGAFIGASHPNGAKWNFNLGQSAFSGAVPTGFEPGWPAGSEAALGHTTWGRLQTLLTNYGAATNTYIELGERLVVKATNSGGNELAHVGLNNFKLDGSGKYYFEMWNILSTSTVDPYGIMTNDATVANVAQISPQNCAVVISSTGNIWSNNANSGRSLGQTYGGNISCAVDFINRKVWFRLNGGNWNGQAIGLQDPANNIGGVSISNYTAKTMGPVAGMGNSFAGHKTVFYLSPADMWYSGTAPAGFTVGWPIAPLDVTGPVFTSSAAVNNTEYNTLAHAITLNESATLAIVGGADQARFELSGTTLRWLSNGFKSYGAPDDSDTNNTYLVTVRATDIFTNFTDQTITVTVVPITWANFAGGDLTGITVSDANLGVAPAGGAYAVAVASTAYKNAGKYYFECTHTDVGVNGEGMGLVFYGYDPNSVYALNPHNCIFVNAGGNIFIRGSQQVSIGVFAVGEVCCIALNLDTYRFWARRNGGNWNNSATANPATGVEGVDISYLYATLAAPMGEFHQNSAASGAKKNFNFGQAAFTQAVPSGFMPGWPAGNQVARGHPTYSYLNYNWSPHLGQEIWIEKGEALISKPNGSGGSLYHTGADQFRNSGKFYVEFEMIAGGSNMDGVGFMTHDATLGDVTGITTCFNAAYTRYDGAIYSNNANSGLSVGNPRTAGDTICAAIDFTNQKVWFRIVPLATGVAGNWNGVAIGSSDPANNLGGVSVNLFTPAKPMGPVIGNYSFPGPIFGANFGERTFKAAVPVGFTSGWPKVPATPPAITSSASVSVQENFGLAHTLTADKFVTWSIVGGSDSTKLEISGSTLRWALDAVKDYEAPDDSNTDNVYVVTVRATDLAAQTTDQTISVTVTNITETVITTPANFYGAQVYKSADQIGANYATAAPIAWHAKHFDTNGLWSGAAGTKFKVPASMNGMWATLYVLVTFNNNAGLPKLTIRKNGVIDWRGAGGTQNGSWCEGVTSRLMIHAETQMIQLATDDEFDVLLQVFGDTAVDIDAGRSSFAIHARPGPVIGALVYRTTDLAQYFNWTTLTGWNAELYDSDGAGGGFHDNVTNNGRIVIPASMNGRVGILRFCVRLSVAVANNNWNGNILRNGVAFIGLGQASQLQMNGDASGLGYMNVVTQPHVLRTGDYYEVQMRYGGGPSSTLVGAYTTFGIEVYPLSFKGCLCSITTDLPGTNASAGITLSWNKDEFDPDNIHDPTGTPTQLIVPAPLDGSMAILTCCPSLDQTTAFSSHSTTIQRDTGSGPNSVYEGTGGLGAYGTDVAGTMQTARTQIVKLVAGHKYTALFYSNDTSQTIQNEAHTFGMRLLNLAPDP